MEKITIDWKRRLKRLYLQDLAERSPGFFQMSGGYGMKIKPYNDTTANGLTRAIVDWIRFHGGDAQRINSTGIPREVNGKMKWTPGGMRRGTADIHAIIRGRAVSIEVKVGRDKMSEWQKQERERVERAGGLYYVARNMPEFIEWFENLKS